MFINLEAAPDWIEFGKTPTSSYLRDETQSKLHIRRTGTTWNKSAKKLTLFRPPYGLIFIKDRQVLSVLVSDHLQTRLFQVIIE